MAGSGDRVGALVVGHRVGEQDLAALRYFDVALGDGERQLIVVLDLVGLEDDRRVLVLSSVALARKLRQARRGGEQQGKDRADHRKGRAFGERSVSRPGGTCHAPSLRRNGMGEKDLWQPSVGKRGGHPSSR